MGLEGLNERPNKMSTIGAEERELLQVGEEWARAMVANDAERIGSFMAEEWVIVSDRGISGKDHFLSLFAAECSLTAPLRCRATLV